jgi:ubiquinone biosynthesis protein
MEFGFEALAQRIGDPLPRANGQLPGPAVLCGRVKDFLEQAWSLGSLDDVVRQMVGFVGVDRLLPDSYVRFQPMVTESMVFWLRRLPLERLARKITDQLLLDPAAPPGRRICVLIKDMPSLQKLGQIICRTPGLAAEFKLALVELEDQVGTLSLPELLLALEEELKSLKKRSDVTLEDRVLAEASVCATVGATLRTRGKKHAVRAVLKILKPQVPRNLAHELNMLNELALFLDRNRASWGLRDFKFKDTLGQVQWLLQNEIKLSQEQDNLREAGRYYRHFRKVRIPRCLAGSTPAMTVMSRLDGRKITDVEGLTPGQKRALVESLTESCILRPIKDLGERTLFHGDPHGGNIAYVFEKNKARIIFYDWGMLGRLSRLERYAFALMGLGVIARSAPMVLVAGDIAAGGRPFKDMVWRSDLGAAVKRILGKRGTLFGEVLADIGAIFGEFSYRGIVFPTDLLMFQKSLVTLKGVFADIDPGFDCDKEWMGIAVGSYLGDLGRPRTYFEIYREIWALGRFSALRILQMHLLVAKLIGRVAGAGLKVPLRIAGVT